MKKDRWFITFEGSDGVGKTTQAKKLGEWFGQKGHPILLTREPGGGPVAERIRSLLLDPEIRMEARTELFLYEAARIEHIEKVIRPALAGGTTVLCDRFTDATTAYQGFARGLPLDMISLLNGFACAGLKPDLTIWLDLPARQGLENAMNRKGSGDRIENEGVVFQEHVRKGYETLHQQNPERIVRIDVENTIDITHRKIIDAVQRRIRL